MRYNDFHTISKIDWDAFVICVLPDSELRSVLRVFGKESDCQEDYTDTSDGHRYWFLDVYSHRLKCDLKIAATTQVGAGNYRSALRTAQLIERFKPQAIFLCGIAAGIRGKVYLGDVIVSSEVVGYEPGRLERIRLLQKFKLLRLLFRLLPFPSRKFLGRPIQCSSPYPMKGDVNHFSKYSKEFQQHFRDAYFKLVDEDPGGQFKFIQ